MRAVRVLMPLLMMGSATACLPASDAFHPEEVHLMQDALPPMAGAPAQPGDSILVAGPLTASSGAGGPSGSELRKLEELELY